MICINDKLAEIGPFVPQPDDDLIVCRCEEITKGEIRQAVHQGICTVTEMRRWLRSGMGLCQGQTCGKLVQGIMAREFQVPLDQMPPAPARTPMRPTEMGVLAQDGGNVL